MDDFSLCVRENRESLVRGEMGRSDMMVIGATDEAVRTGRKVTVTV